MFFTSDEIRIIITFLENIENNFKSVNLTGLAAPSKIIDLQF